MKKTSITFLLFLLVATFSFSINGCRNDIKENAIGENDQFSDLKLKSGQQGGKKYHVYCDGQMCTNSVGVFRECHLESDIANGGFDWVQCSCSTCVLHYDDGNGKALTPSEINDFKTKDILYESFMKYIEIEFPNDTVFIEQITYEEEIDGPNSFILYEYEVAGVKKTVGLYNDITNDKKKTVACNSTSCDCRPRYYPSTDMIECSCSPCTITIDDAF